MTQLARILNPRWWRFATQRRVVTMDARRARADRIAAHLPRAATTDVAGGAALDRDGFLMLPTVDGQKIEALRSYLESQDAYDPYRPALGEFRAPGAAPTETHVANFRDDVLVNAPHALEFANDPAVLAAVGTMLGCKPTIALLSAWWSMPSANGAEHAELFHRDIDDYRFVKLFIYLTDVDEDSGPHGFMKGSQNVERHMIAGSRIPDADVMEAFGAENLMRFTGGPGTRFLENTYGVHRGFPPKSKPRLIFQVLYTQRPVIYSPKHPLAKARDELDTFTNRLYLA